MEKKAKNEALLKKASLDMDLVDECPEDVKFAQLLSLQSRKDAEDLVKEDRQTIQHQDIFTSDRVKATPSDLTAKEIILKAAKSESVKMLKTGGFVACCSSPSSTLFTNKSIKDLGIVRKKTNLCNTNNTDKCDFCDKTTVNVDKATDNNVSPEVSISTQKSGSSTFNPMSMLSNYNDSSDDENSS